MFAQSHPSMQRPKQRLPLAVFAWRIALLALLLLSACAGAPASQSEAPSGGMPESAPREPVAGESAADMDTQAANRLIIKNARMNLVVPDPAQSMQTIGAMAEEMGGYVVTANVSQRTLDNGQQVPYADINVRVPVERLDEALERIRAESDQPPESESIDSEDVTREYTDLNARLRNLENTEAQLTKIQEAADNTQDVLAVYQELSRVRGEIESLKGQIQYYEQAAALSSVSVRLEPNAAMQPLTVGGWEVAGVAKSAVLALASTLKFLGTAAIWLVIYVIPVAAVILLVFFLPLRWLWRRVRGARPPKRPSAPSTPAAPPTTGAAGS